MDALINQAQVSRQGYRLETIDFLRGLVMIIMALDHTRENFHYGTFIEDPLNLATTTPALFITRWITHFCAPVFVFLSGTSIFLQSLRKPLPELRRFLITRGLWLIAVEIVFITFALTFNVFFSMIILQVIWAIGISMILLGLMIRLPFTVILATGLAIVFLHNVLDFYESKPNVQLPVWYLVLHRQALFPISENFAIGNFYPFLPWTGLMMVGYCFGKLYDNGSLPGRRRTLWLGSGIVLFFVLLRITNLYGDPLPWSQQSTFLYTLFSFVNTQKYPPSLLFICMTIGPALILLGILQPVIRNRFLSKISVYGRVPLFYFLVHFYILHTASAIFFLTRGHRLNEGIHGIDNFPFHFLVPGEGVRLWATYLIWIFLVLILYPICKAYGNYKRTSKKWWLSYL